MINNFINLYKPINIAITISNSKAFKDNKLLVSENKINYLKNTLLIIKVFVKATNKLQGEVYPTIYYTIPIVYNIYNQLERVKEELKVSNLLYYIIVINILILIYLQDYSIFNNAINKGIAKLRKYYPKSLFISSKNITLYISLLLDPRVKQEGLASLGLSTGHISDIYTLLKAEYNS